MKKKIIVFAIVLVAGAVLVSSVIGYTKSMNYIISYTPSVEGVVTAVYDDSFLLLGGPTESDPPVEYSVSRDAENGDSYEHIMVGDMVYVHYDGTIAESDPPQINRVYAIIFGGSAEIPDNTPV